VKLKWDLTESRRRRTGLGKGNRKKFTMYVLAESTQSGGKALERTGERRRQRAGIRASLSGERRGASEAKDCGGKRIAAGSGPEQGKKT